MEWKETWKMTLMNNSDTEFVFKIETLKKIAFPMIKRNVFSVTTNLDPLQKLLVDQSNFYIQQNGREFKTNIDEMKAFLGINYFMIINKLLTIKSYQEWGQYVDNLGIRNVMSGKFEQISQRLHFADKQKDEKTDKAQ